MITLKEIFEQPEKLKKISENYTELVKSTREFILNGNFKKIVFVGCGTSYYLSMGLAYQLRRISAGKISSDYFSGSEIMFGLRDIEADTLVVGVSRSGESSETVKSLEVCKKNGISTAAVTCEPGSSMVKIADSTIAMDFIEEESIVMTKSFSSMGFVLSALFRDLYASETLKEYLKGIPIAAENVLKQSDEFFSKADLTRYDRFALLGYDEYFAACMEGLIKVTETSLSEVDAFQTLEYRHGPKSKVYEKTFLAFLPNSLIKEEEFKVAAEMSAMGGFVLNISPFDHVEFETIKVDYGCKDYGDWVVRVIPLQLLGVKKAVSKGLDPDKPQNLSKVVKF